MRQYTAVLMPDEQDGGYTVLVPALPGCVTEGDTVDEAMENARDAVRLYLEDLREYGEPIPREIGPPLLQAVEV